MPHSLSDSPLPRRCTSRPRYLLSPHTTPIMNLPVEILSEIARYIPERHATYGYVVESANIASFSAVSRTMHAVSLPVLFRQIPITSEKQLHALGTIPDYLFPFVRELDIFMDGDFLQAWRFWASVPFGCLREQKSPYETLVDILSRSPSLRALRMRVAEPSGIRSAWRKFTLSRAFGIPMDATLKPILENRDPFLLPVLNRLELDGFQDIESLLRLAPSLQVLHLSLSAGFSQTANTTLVTALRHAPSLRDLKYTPDSLRLNSGAEEDGNESLSEDTFHADNLSNVELVKALGIVLPKLRRLDLTNRWFGHGIYYSSTSEPISPDALVDALKSMPNLKSLALPSSVFSPKDFDLLRTPIPIYRPENARQHLPTLHAVVEDRHQALSRVATGEKHVIERIGSVAPGIQDVRFVRNAIADDRLEYAVKYGVNVVPERTIHVGARAPPIVRPPRADIISVDIVEAKEDQVPPWPYVPSTSLAHTLRKLWTALPDSRQMIGKSCERTHQGVAMLVASAGGCVISDAVCGVNGCSDNALVASMVMGSAVYAYSRLR
ncbi:hypothetical protein BS47DRAFT_1336729 [Hydnum rufescens UP504]|uniref:F-box domain-containing protein n=1 Tax=Hydnum rufescens UP504 TaxID=1448309 RepID=A0A9P6B8M9_9AGAM|nr:hypothetical protein BS47DRAFT_1336729 [Hydnum rufescens UP504]